MAIQARVAGAALVRIAVPAASALVDLGYTRNGVNESYEAFFLNIPGDQNGGDDGPPIEIQWLGEIARVRLELTTWEETTADLIRRRIADASAVNGVPWPTVGQLMFTGSKVMRLLIEPAITGQTPDPARNFPRAIPRGVIEINKGTKYSSLVCEFECHKDASGVLWNTAKT